MVEDELDEIRERINGEITERKIEEQTGIPTVDFRRIEDERDIILRVYSHPAIKPHLSNVERLIDYNPEDEREFHYTGLSPAIYEENTNTIRISKSALGGDAKDEKMVGGTPTTTLIHEAGHASHDENLEAEDISRFELPGPKIRDNADEIRDGVSEYALTDEAEFVAETFTALTLGKDVPDAVVEIYQDDFFGPEVTETWP